MKFTASLQEALVLRGREAVDEQAAGVSLEAILDRYLRAVEAAADSDLLTSVLLLDAQGRRLLHGAAPSLPKAYCEAIHGIEIGPDVGSCGTAAYLNCAIYVTDIAADPLWRNFKHLALGHGLRACWSTPIKDAQGQLLGTFAIYHLTPRSPTPEELEVVRLVTSHVAEAITTYRRPELEADATFPAKPGGAVASKSPIRPYPGGLPRKAVAETRLWRRMQQIERCRHRAEVAARRSDGGSPAFQREMAEAAQEWNRLAREYELLLAREEDNPET